MSRRSFLYTASGAAISIGLGFAAWPLFTQMNPDAGTLNQQGIVNFDLAELKVAQMRELRWHSMPVFVARRTAEILSAMQNISFVSQLIDPNSTKRQQPAYAKNWHRSINPDFSVLIGICTACACVPRYGGDGVVNTPGGYGCPCCASQYDSGGRPYSGPAQFNLPVPPHRIVDRTKLVIGHNVAGTPFTIESVERM